MDAAGECSLVPGRERPHTTATKPSGGTLTPAAIAVAPILHGTTAEEETHQPHLATNSLEKALIATASSPERVRSTSRDPGLSGCASAGASHALAPHAPATYTAAHPPRHTLSLLHLQRACYRNAHVRSKLARQALTGHSTLSCSQAQQSSLYAQFHSGAFRCRCRCIRTHNERANCHSLNPTLTLQETHRCTFLRCEQRRGRSRHGGFAQTALDVVVGRGGQQRVQAGIRHAQRC